MGRIELLIRVLVVFLSASSLVAYISYTESVPSVSDFWNTPLQPLFIITNAATSYYFFSMKNWKVSAMLLLFLTAFSVEDHFVFHNVLASMFFIWNLFVIAKNKRLALYAIPYAGSFIAFLWYGFFWAEVLAISVLSFYHLHYLWVIHKLRRKRLQIKKERL